MHSVSSLLDAGDSGQTKEIKGDRAREEGVMSRWAKNKAAQRPTKQGGNVPKTRLESSLFFLFFFLLHAHTHTMDLTDHFGKSRD